MISARQTQGCEQRRAAWPKRLALLALLLWLPAAAFGSIASTSGNVIYVDTSNNVSPKLQGNYVSFNVTNDTGSPIADAWVTIGTFTGGFVSLAPSENGIAHLGAMSTGASSAVFFYLQVNCSSFNAGQCNVSAAQGFTVTLYSGPPTSNPLQSQSFSATVSETISSSNNTVSSVTVSTASPTLGSTVNVTVSGSTGTIGSAKTFYASPQTNVTFPAATFRLINTSVTFSGANTGTVTNQLLVPTSTFSSTASTSYSFVATYLVVGTTSTSTAVAPVAFISSGAQIKHTDTSSFAQLSPIGAASNSLTLSKLVNNPVWPSGGTATFTLRVTNSASSTATLDDFADTLPSSPAGVTYATGTSTFAGSAISDPAISGSTLTWTRAFAIPASGSVDLTFQAVVPNVAGSYTNSAVAHLNGNQIDTTTSTADNSPATVSLSVGSPDLTITKSHTGNFAQGQTGATYSITVSNAGSGPSVGTVSVVDALPTGLTATALSGTGWSCTLGTLTCTRSDVLNSSASYPAATLTVNVASDAPTSVTNTATVSGGGETNTANDSASDPATITQLPDLTVSKTHAGNFTQGQAGATYSIVVTNAGGTATSGTVTVVDTLPAGLTATALSGTGWSCTLGTLTCTRSDALAAAGSYPAITLTVDVAGSAAASVTNNVAVSGGGESDTSNDSASDVTTIVQLADLTVSKSHTGNFTQGETGATYIITVHNVGTGATTGAVTVDDTLPTGLSATAISGTGWSCTLGTLSCTRSDALAAAGSYPAITLTVDVAGDAAASVTNSVAVSGGGESDTSNDTASDMTTIGPAPAATSTSLSVSPALSIGAGTQISLTATVTASASPVFPGVVDFCNTTATRCAGLALLGTSQLKSDGTAELKLTPGAGTYSLVASFRATAADQSSSSTPQSLTVTGVGGYATSTTISSTGTQASYSVTGTVAAFGKPVPTGTISFLDASNGNNVLGSPPLDSATLGLASTLLSGSSGITGTPAGGATADINNDGIVDAVIATGSIARASIFLGYGDGSFGPEATVNSDPTGPAVAVAVGDFNGDGNLDLAILSSPASGPGSVSILLGNGDGTFQTRILYPTGSQPSAIVVADFDGDGNADLAVANKGDNSVSVLFGEGDGTFHNPVALAVDAAPVGLVAAELKNDGVIDLITVNNAGDTISVLLGNGDGTFATQAPYPVGNSPAGIVAADFNDDGDIDVAIANQADGSIGILLGNGDGTFQGQTTFTAGVSPSLLALGDFDGDGQADLAVSDATTGTIGLFLGNGDGTFKAPATATPEGTPSLMLSGDVNGDGLTDVLTASGSASAVLSVLLSQHTESAAIAGVSFADAGTHLVEADYSGDSAYAASQSSPITLSGSGATSTSTDLTASPNPATSGQGVLLTATITPTPSGAPLGTVSFYDNSTLLATVSVDSSGVAATTVTTLGVGSHSITAVYSGNNGFATSTSNVLTELIDAASPTATSTSLSAGPNPATPGQAVLLTATITPVPSGSPLGTVNFFDGATLLGSGNVNGSGVATFSDSSLAVGSHVLTATYSGNAGFASSTSSSFTEIIASGALTTTTTTLLANPNPVTAGQTLTLTATVSPSPSGSPLGTVSFFDGSTLLGTVNLNSSGIATLSLSTLGVGAHSVTAVYSGNAGFATSTSSAISVTVTLAYAVSAPQTPFSVVPGSAVTIPVNVAPTGSSFSNVVTMSATGLPPGATASFSPATVVPGNTGALTNMTIQTAAQTAMPVPIARVPYALCFALLGLGLMSLKRRGARSWIPARIALLLCLASVIAFTGCSGGFAGKPAPRTFVITVTGTSGSLQSSTTVTLVLQ